MQSIIANKLPEDFIIQQEWSYIDKDSKDIRTLDIYAEKWLYSLEDNQPRVRPHLNLLIECKQSELPFIFFCDRNIMSLYSFPIIAGLFKDRICIATDDTLSTYTVPFLTLFDLTEHDFIINAPKFCLSFCKCVRKGKELELSGTESYNSIVFPLLKATESFVETQYPPKKSQYFDAHLTFPIAIIDAPMIGVSVTEQNNELVYIPWVRVLRHKTDNSKEWFDRECIYAIDIVHKDFFSLYLEKHLLPFVSEFADYIIKHQYVIASGLGFVRGIEKDPFNLEARLEVRTSKK